jgi:hypothetical protein
MDQHIDPERIAAYMDGALSRDERAAAEAHLADCPRCLHLLAAMVRTEESGPAQRGFWSLPVVRWGVPLVAGATAVALWINVLPHRAMQSPPPSSDSQAVGPAREPSAPAATDEQPLLTVDALQRQNAKSEEGKTRADDRAARMAPHSTEGAGSSESPDPAAKVSAAPARATEEANPAAVVPNSAELGRDMRLQDRLAETAAARVAPATLEIVSDDSGTRWRILGNTIVRSSDGGATWNTEAVSVERELTAGSSPSRQVAWFVGRQGYILLTAASQWKQITFPEPVDLVSITARSEREADVTTADGRVFATADGGQTWTRR